LQRLQQRADLVARVATALVAWPVVLPSAMEPAAGSDAMELGAASLGIGTNSNSLVAKTWSPACNYNSAAAQQTWSHPPNSAALVAPVIQSWPSAMELLAAMERPPAMEPAAIRDVSFGIGTGSHSCRHYFFFKINLIIANVHACI